jgi:hypothetical protein
MAAADARERAAGAQCRRAVRAERGHRRSFTGQRSSSHEGTTGPSLPHFPHLEAWPLHCAWTRCGRHGLVRRPGLRRLHRPADRAPCRRTRSNVAHACLPQRQLRRRRGDRWRAGHGRRRIAGRLRGAARRRRPRVRRLARPERRSGRPRATRTDAARRSCAGLVWHGRGLRLRRRSGCARIAAARDGDIHSVGARCRCPQCHRRRQRIADATGIARKARAPHVDHTAPAGSRAPAGVHSRCRAGRPAGRGARTRFALSRRGGSQGFWHGDCRRGRCARGHQSHWQCEACNCRHRRRAGRHDRRRAGSPSTGL